MTSARWRSWTARRRAAVAERHAAAEEWRRDADRIARWERQARLASERRAFVDTWLALERTSASLAAAATRALAAFLDGPSPPWCLPDERVPSGAAEWRWLLAHGLVRHRYEAAQLPVTQSGPHVYGHRGFSGYCVTPEARDVFRHLFGAEVWQE